MKLIVHNLVCIVRSEQSVYPGHNSRCAASLGMEQQVCCGTNFKTPGIAKYCDRVFPEEPTNIPVFMKKFPAVEAKSYQSPKEIPP
jgi:hypothetical protein